MFRSQLKNPDIETVAFEAMGHLKGAFALRYGQDDVGHGRRFDFGRDQSNRLHRQINQVLRTQGASSHPKLTQFLETTASELALLDRDFYDEDPAISSAGWSNAFEYMQTRLDPMVDDVVSTVYPSRMAAVAKSLQHGDIEDPSLVERVAIVLGGTVADTPLSQPVPVDPPAKPFSLARFLSYPVGQRLTVEAVALETIGHVKGAFNVDYGNGQNAISVAEKRLGWQRRVEKVLDADGYLAHPAVKDLLTETVTALRDIGEAGEGHQAQVEAAKARLGPLADAALNTVFAGKLQQVATRFQSGTATKLSKNDRLALALTADIPKPVAQPAPMKAAP